MVPHDLLHDGKAQAPTPRAALTGAIGPIEGLKNVVRAFVGDAVPCIRHGELDRILDAPIRDLDGAARGHVLKSVGDQIGQRLADARRIQIKCS